MQSSRQGPFPIELAPAQIRRILDRHPTTLILTRTLKPGTYAVEDQVTNRQNAAYKRAARRDLQADPHVFMIEIAGISSKALLNVAHRDVRSAGYHHQREFFDDWLDRHGCIQDTRTIHLCAFTIIEDARFLHRKLHRGYTRNPLEAAWDEPQALDVADLERYAASASLRRENERRAELTLRDARSLAIRLKDASRRGDADAVGRIRGELESLEQRMRAA